MVGRCGSGPNLAVIGIAPVPGLCRTARRAPLMAIPHAKSGDVIDVRPLGPTLAAAQTTTLVKTPTLEIIRLILRAGKEICHHHEMIGEITVQCLEGRITVQVNGEPRVLEAGQLLYLAGHEPHAIRGLDDASVLLTILLR